MLRRLTRCSSLCGESKLKAFCFQWRVPAAPREAGALRGGADAPSSALLPMGGPTRPTPGVPFVSRRKGAAPLDPLRGARWPPCGVAAPPRKGFYHKNRPICHFELVGKSVFIFLLKLYRGSHFLLLIRGSAGGFGFCVLPEWHPFLGGAALAAAGGMIMPPKGSTQRGFPLWEILW